MARLGSGRALTQDRTLIFLVRAACVVIILAGLHFSKPVLAPLIVSALLAFALSPLANYTERVVRVRWLTIGIVAGIVIGTTLMGSWFVVSQVSTLQAQLPEYSRNVRARVSAIAEEVQAIKKQVVGSFIFSNRAGIGGGSDKRRLPDAFAEEEGASDALSAPPAMPGLELVSSFLVSLFSFVVFILTVSVFAIFLLLGRRDIRDRWIRFVGGNDIPGTAKVVDETSRQVGRYLGAQLTVNVIFGLSLALALFLIGIPQPLLWGTVAILFRFVPFVGGIFSAAPPMLLSLAVDASWATPLWTLSAYSAIEGIVSQFIEPTFIGRKVGVSGFALLLAAAFWTATWGITGLLISTPVTVCLISLGRYVPSLNFLTILCGDEEVMGVPERLYHRLISNDLTDVQELLRSNLPTELMLDAAIARVADSTIFPAMAVARRDYSEGRLSLPDYRLLARRLGAQLETLTSTAANSADKNVASGVNRAAVLEVDHIDGPMAFIVRRMFRACGIRVVAAPSPHPHRENYNSRNNQPVTGRVLVLVTMATEDVQDIRYRARAARRIRAERVVVFAPMAATSIEIAQRFNKGWGKSKALSVVTGVGELLQHVHYGSSSSTVPEQEIVKSSSSGEESSAGALPKHLKVVD